MKTKVKESEKNKDKYILQINKDRREQKYFFYILLNACIHTLLQCVFFRCYSLLCSSYLSSYCCSLLVLPFSYAWCLYCLSLPLENSVFYSLENQPESMFYAALSLSTFIFIFLILNCLHYFQFQFHFP